MGTLAVARVSNSAPHANQMLSTVITFIEARRELGVLGEIETEPIPHGD